MATPLKKKKGGKARKNGPNSGAVVARGQTLNFCPETSFPMMKALALIVPDRVRMRLKYSENVNLTTTFASQPGVQVWNGNSIYDPDKTGVGGTVSGASQWAAFYSYYLVVRSAVKVVCINGVTTAIRLCLLPSLGVITNTNTTANLIEQPLAVGRYLNSNAGGHDMTTISHEASTAAVYGVKPEAVLSELQYSAAAVSANPALPWYWGLSVNSIAGVALGFNVEMEITYDVIFWNRITLAG